jgi:hypothetical protein
MPVRRKSKPYDPSARAHDRRGFYSRAGNFTFDEIPDPYVHASDREPVEMPTVPTLVVARSRADLLAGLHVRKQIGDAEFQAGRAYQRLAEQADRGIKSSPLEPRVQYGRVDGVPQAVLIAARRLRLLDGKIVLQFGVVRIVTLRATLIQGMNPKKIAMRFGDPSQRGCDWYARLLRETLVELSVLTGFASRPAAWRPVTAWAAAAVVEAAAQEASDSRRFGTYLGHLVTRSLK